MTVEPKTLTLTEFLLARIAEDEAWVITGDCECSGSDLTRLPACPDRVLAECEAKRRIVEQAASFLAGPDMDPFGVEQMLETMAAVYSDHPDFDEAWRA